VQVSAPETGMIDFMFPEIQSMVLPWLVRAKLIAIQRANSESRRER
jgi:hypothetical protein